MYGQKSAHIGAVPGEVISNRKVPQHTEEIQREITGLSDQVSNLQGAIERLIEKCQRGGLVAPSTSEEVPSTPSSIVCTPLGRSIRDYSDRVALCYSQLNNLYDSLGV